MRSPVSRRSLFVGDVQREWSPPRVAAVSSQFEGEPFGALRVERLSSAFGVDRGKFTEDVGIPLLCFGERLGRIVPEFLARSASRCSLMDTGQVCAAHEVEPNRPPSAASVALDLNCPGSRWG